MADIPNEPVGRGIEYVVQRHCQLDHAEPSAEVATGLGHRVDGLVPQLVGQLLELVSRQVFDIAWELDAVEQRGPGRIRQKQLQTNLVIISRRWSPNRQVGLTYTNFATAGNSMRTRQQGPVFAT